jgi:hypothetical protein
MASIATMEINEVISDEWRNDIATNIKEAMVAHFATTPQHENVVQSCGASFNKAMVREARVL